MSTPQPQPDPLLLRLLERYGVALAIVLLALMFVSAAPGLLFRPRGGNNESAAVSQLRTINTAQVTYLSSEGRYGTILELISIGLLDSRFEGPVSGYRFTISVTSDGKDYVARADRVSENSGRFNFVSGSDAVVKYGSTAPSPEYVGQPVQ